MLAYELYRKNNQTKSKNVKDANPVKLAYLMSSKITFDNDLSQYTYQELHPKFSYLQEWLQMPMSTYPEMPVNLYAGGRAPKPYVIITGSYKKEENKPVIILNMNKYKTHTFEAKLLLDKEKPSIILDCKGSIKLGLTKTGYRIDGTSTYDIYRKNKIIDENDCFDAKLFSSISEAFFDHIKSHKPLEDIQIPKRPLRFDIWLMPQKGDVTLDQNQEDGIDLGKDCFDNVVNYYPSRTTTNAQFLSYDDKAFTINCTKKQEFYKNLNIGNNSFEQISLLPDLVFSIYDLHCLFFNTENKDVEFESTNKGILSRLYANWKKQDDFVHDVKKDKPTMKFICYEGKKTSSQKIIRIDENLSNSKLRQIFTRLEIERSPEPCALESLIIGKTNFSYYLMALRSVFTNVPIRSHIMLKVLNKLAVQMTKKYFKCKGNPETFFNQTKYSLLLSTFSEEQKLSHHYAQKIGMFARMYVDFKSTNKDGKKLPKNMLVFSKYDYERLQFVFNKICRGIFLSSISDDELDKKQKEIQSLLKDLGDMPNDLKQKDLTYFFYNGYFVNKEEVNDG